MAKRTSRLIKLIIIIIIQIFCSLHKETQNCLPVKVQHANQKKVEVLIVFSMQKERFAQFVQIKPMGVKVDKFAKNNH